MQSWTKAILERSDYDRLSVDEVKAIRLSDKYDAVIECVMNEQAEADRGIADDGYDVLERSVWRSEGMRMPEKSWLFRKTYGHFSEDQRCLVVVGEADLSVDLEDVLPSDFKFSELLRLYRQIIKSQRS